MNQQQAQTVIGQAQQIDSFDFEVIIKRVYPDRTDLENIVISQLSLPEFYTYQNVYLDNFYQNFKTETIILFCLLHLQIFNLDRQILTDKFKDTLLT
jgi:hypothetical protein